MRYWYFVEYRAGPAVTLIRGQGYRFGYSAGVCDMGGGSGVGSEQTDRAARGVWVVRWSRATTVGFSRRKADLSFPTVYLTDTDTWLIRRHK